MSKRYKNERYHVAVPHPQLSAAQSVYARETMNRLLADVDLADWFGKDDEDGTVHYVFRTYKLGKVVEEALLAECSRLTDAHRVWGQRHWVRKPSRIHVGLFTDEGICAIVAPGDTFKGMMFKQVNGKVTQGWFNQSGKHLPSRELGKLVRLWFQGESTAVWNAQRRFRYEMDNPESKHYGDIEYALEKARDLLGNNAAIHCVNDKGDLYTISAYGIEASNYCTKFDRGEQWVFEYGVVPVGIPHEDVVYSTGKKSVFKQQLLVANTMTILKRVCM
ncbi:hypothetical protein ST201phi2-1p410 [Pseudomonas phage 201phi2-1]|uniref:Uncharacterized protein n=1 Tax=Pseudomonas phage 201phi2-1 TaxID=198110 RepID=B3FJR9_BP201|nr:hypothetical protein ST201phi2-1p410 [Pseudomonas phage 201phi2-1]ABY63234.1 hypothetical protein 201phi2-1p410 [Pseudomonas phage 201phi2-1]